MLQVCTPSCVLLKGYLYGESAEAQVNSEFHDLMDRLQAQVAQNDEQALIGHRAIDDEYELFAKLLAGHDYCVLQVWVTPISDDLRATFDRALQIMDEWLPARVDEPFFQDATALFSSRVLCCQDPILLDQTASFFAQEPRLAHSTVYSGQLRLTAGQTTNRGLYLVTPVDGPVPNELMSAVVDDICRVETYFKKILSFYDVYPGIYEGVNRAEEEVVAQMDEMSIQLGDADTQVLGAWLTTISQKYGQLSVISKGLRQDSFSLHSNLSNIRSAVRAWDEARVEASMPISEVLLNDAEMVCGAYDGLSERIQGIQEQLGNMTAMVRTRIELGQQQQSLQQLRDLVKMERTMDVLEFVFLAAVLLDIFGFVFAGMGEIWGRGTSLGAGFHYVATHLWEYPALLTALFVPVILGLSYLIVKLVERLTE
jgi:uncharacterized membrane-anchored protein